MLLQSLDFSLVLLHLPGTPSTMLNKSDFISYKFCSFLKNSFCRSIVDVQCINFYCTVKWFRYIRVCVCVCVCVCVFSCVWLFVILYTVARQVPLSMGFPSQEYWGRLPFPPPEGIFLTQGSNVHLLWWQMCFYHCAAWETREVETHRIWTLIRM